MSAYVKHLKEDDPLITLLFNKLLEVVDDERFKDMNVAVIVGTIEFLKVKLVNRN